MTRIPALRRWERESRQRRNTEAMRTAGTVIAWLIIVAILLAVATGVVWMIQVLVAVSS